MCQRCKMLLVSLLVLYSTVCVALGNARGFFPDASTAVHNHEVLASSSRTSSSLGAVTPIGNAEKRNFSSPDIPEEREASILGDVEITTDGALQLPGASYSYGTVTISLTPSVALFLPVPGFHIPGFEDATSLPFLTLSLERGRFEIHAGGGAEINLDHLHPRSLHATAGVRLHATERFSLFFEAMRNLPFAADRTGMNPSLTTLEAGVGFSFSESAGGFFSISQFLVGKRLLTEMATVGVEISF